MGTSLPDFEESRSQVKSPPPRRQTTQTPKMVEMKGTYERSAAENYEAFLDALGVGMILKKAATATTPVMTVSEEGGQWTIKTSTMLKSMELKFKLGEEFDEKTPDGREVTSIVTQEGDKLICKQTAKKDSEASTVSTREFFDDKCVLHIEIVGKGVSCTQTFTRK